ncbi:MAG: 3-hydroxyacyl-CoA dehydrogenase family protein [Candidatus Dormibacteraeota bacterium]|nr:3-hydroxyacyl-CoA dehydrogenase family protein [Candidatus Dormibacteraeota bacterium]MBV9526690.1 3-hydroxyacyl-CoA dehydrogenase family protein [Candidatus Dormibacteraeota bacterium]
MGSQIAQQAALHGVEVWLHDIDAARLERAMSSNRQWLERRVERGKLDTGQAEAAARGVTPAAELAPAARDSAWAIEAVAEEASVKREVFAQLDAHLPAGAGIATNSSNIVVSRLASATGRAKLCCNMHFFHPVLVMDLCEVVRGPDTAAETVERAVAWSRRMGRTPVVVEREIDGFIVNRVLGAASREAFTLLAEGVASVADIDTAARTGLNWPMGPFQLADFSGLDVVLGVRRDRLLREGHAGDDHTVRILQSLVDAGRLGRKSGRGFYDYAEDPPAALPLPD